MPTRLAILAPLILLLAFPVLTLAGEIRAYAEPVPAPSLDLPDLDGNPVTLTDLHGRVVLVNFWGTWCPPCVEEMPSIQRLQNQLSDRPFSVLAVNVNEARNRVAAFAKRNDIALRVLQDATGDVSRAWDVQVFPTSYLVDGSGQVRYRALGPVDWDSGEPLEATLKLLSEKTLE